MTVADNKHNYMINVLQVIPTTVQVIYNAAVSDNYYDCTVIINMTADDDYHDCM